MLEASTTSDAQNDDLLVAVGSQIACALAAERIAINQQLMQHHQSLLTQVDLDLRRHFGTAQRRECTVDVDKLGGIASFELTAAYAPPKLGENVVGPASMAETKAHETEHNATAPVVPVAREETSEGLDDEELADIRECVNTTSLQRSISGVEYFRQEAKRKGFFVAVVENPWFEAFFVCLVSLNALISAFQAQYHGFDVGFDIDFPGVRSNAVNAWPGAKEIFYVLEVFFAVFYTVELVLKFMALRCKFWRDRWNVFDLFLVCFWYVSEITGNLPVNPLILRLARLSRLMRLVKRLEWLESFDSLRMLIVSIKYSLAVFSWSVIILFVLFLVMALFVNGLLADYFEDQGETKAKRREVYEYFGTFTRSLVSVFEISFGNHARVSRTLFEHVDEKWGVFFLLYKSVVSLSFMKVITGVFLHETFKVCAEDDELMMIRKKREMKTHSEKMNRLFKKVDESGDGLLTKEEFEHVMSDDWVKSWLLAMELDASDVRRLWKLVDDGDGNVTPEGLVNGVFKLKGGSKSVDVHHLVHEVDIIASKIKGIEVQIKESADILRSRQSSLPNSNSSWVSVGTLQANRDTAECKQQPYLALAREYDNMTFASM